MRKPRDIDSELRALAEKTKGLKARKITQLGEVVAATGADALDVETLAGVLLSAVEAKDGAKEEWRRKGADFFQRARGGGASRSRAAQHAQGAP
ncbi:conjugal transfer protein TraD [Phenylobacterium soli]|uniref:Conjugal transfer protein TraD n=1 Tax=Phenylobacterium soli TaxID=2170551 RepID=A0A328ANE9_9CAUL|nr:conjugal transfer protein TraD [Phenylobacterium soli]RAK55901.1 conjugal transfer protein TraD [Phenylobacterium soli]